MGDLEDLVEPTPVGGRDLVDDRDLANFDDLDSR